MQEEKSLITDITQLPDRMTVRDVATWLQLGETVIYELCREGDLPHARICRARSKKGRGVIRFDKSELIKWWNRQRSRSKN